MLKATPSLFTAKYKLISQLFRQLIAVPPESPNSLLTRFSLAFHRPRISGVYVFSDPMTIPETVMYVGQSNDLIHRLEEHCAVDGVMKANFAFMLTVRTTGLTLIPGTPSATKKSLLQDDRFKDGFDQAINRIKCMNYRFLQVDDRLTKNLLEIYAAVALNSAFNDFD